MKTRLKLVVAGAAALLGCPAVFAGAAASGKSDITKPDQRHTVIELANKLLKPAEVAPLPADIKSPFNPPGFDSPDAGAPGPNPGPAPSSGKPTSAREVLNRVSPSVVGTAYIELGGEGMVQIGQRRFKKGDPLFVTIEGTAYTLEISAVTSTSYTLRYQGEELTKSINKTGTTR